MNKHTNTAVMVTSVVNTPILGHDAIEGRYYNILIGAAKKFPHGFWSCEHGDAYAGRCIRYLINEVYGWDHEQVCKHFSTRFMQRHALGGVLIDLNLPPYACLELAFPGEYKAWEISQTPSSYWCTETGIDAMVWLIESRLKWEPEEVKAKLTTYIFKANGLGAMLQTVFEGSPWKALNASYPGKYHPWELPSAPSNYWCTETGIQCVKWLIEEKLGWDRDTICQNWSIQLLKKHNVYGMLTSVFDGSPYAALNAAYPEGYLPWELRSCPSKTWDHDMAITAVKWLLETKLGWDRETICKNYTSFVFVKHGLNGMLVSVFRQSPWEALNATYPGEYKAWELVAMPKNFWNEETAAQAIRWVVDEKLKWTQEQVYMHMCVKVLHDYKLSHMVKVVFKGSIYRALNNAYPNAYNMHYFRKVHY